MAEIQLRNGGVAWVNDDDLPLVAGRKWRRSKSGDLNYAVCYGSTGKGEPRTILMHRLIMAAKSDVLVDHADRDGLNNRRTNLRFCSNAQNMMNATKLPGKSSRFKGVHWVTKIGKWEAEIMKGGEPFKLGTFDSDERAARQYDRAARLLFGQFARTNQMMGLLT